MYFEQLKWRPRFLQAVFSFFHGFPLRNGSCPRASASLAAEMGAELAGQVENAAERLVLGDDLLTACSILPC